VTDEVRKPPDELPSEDRGADTQRRFRYQAAYAAIRALELLRDDTGREELICEQFERCSDQTRRAQLHGDPGQDAPDRSDALQGDRLRDDRLAQTVSSSTSNTAPTASPAS